MDLFSVVELLRRPRDSRAACRDRLATTARIRNMLDGDDAITLRELATLDACPEAVVAEVQRTSFAAGVKLCERAATAETMPELGEAMANGLLSGRKIDTVTSRLRGLSADDKAVIASQADRLVRAGARQSDRDFDATVKRITDQLRNGQLDRDQQQRRDTRLRVWNDRDSGMVNLRGVFDPELGASIVAAIVDGKERRFHTDELPDTCPADPIERDEHLNALALGAIITGNTSRSDGGGGSTGGGGGADISVLIDARTLTQGPHDTSVIEVAAGAMNIDVPLDTIRRWICSAEVTPIVVAPDGQRIMLGRTQRTANRAQRRALRALYATCACCSTTFDHCHIHHIHWWHHGGPTDVANLLPLCNRCHHLAHNGTMHLHLAPDRTLTTTMRDGTIHVHGPPRTRAA